MSEKIVLGLELNSGKAVKSLGDLEQKATELNNELREVPMGTKAFKDLQQQLVGVNKQIKNTELSMEALDNEQVASEMGSVAGAVGDMTGAFVLLGGTGGALEETAQNIEKALGITMAFKGDIEGFSSARKLFNNILKQSNVLQKANLVITNATVKAQEALGFSTDVTTRSFKTMRAALIATGIGAIVVLIGTLIANWDKLTAAISGTSKAQQINNEVTETAIGNVAEEISASDKLSKILSDETVSREDKNKAIKKLQDEYPDLLANVDAEKDSIEDINRALELNTKLLIIRAKQEAVATLRAEETLKQVKEEIKLSTQQNVTYKENIKQGIAVALGFGTITSAQTMANESSKENIELSKEKNSLFDKLDAGYDKEIQDIKELGGAGKEENDITRERIATKKKASDESTKASQKEVAEKLKADALIEKAEKDKQAKLKALKEQAAETERVAKLTLIEALIQLENEYEDSQLSKEQQELNRVSHKYFTLIEKAKLYGQDVTTLMRSQAAEEKAIRDNNDQLRIDSEKETNEKIAADRQQVSDGFVNTSLQVIDTLMKINSQNAGDTEREQKKAFETNKKLQIAQTLISTYGSAVSSFQAMSGIPYVGPILGAIAAAAAIVSGMAQISAIKKQKFDSPSEGGAGVQTPNLSMGDGAPTIDPVTNTSTVIPTGDLEPQKVFVTETDISATQNKVEVIEAQATI